MGTHIMFQLLVLSFFATLAAAASFQSHPVFGDASVAAGDHCSPYKTCKECLAHDYCGFCSSPVVYKNGTIGAQCAGFDPNSKKPPNYQCIGTYTTDKCPDASQKYYCNDDKKCVPVKFGVSKEDCESSCTGPAPPTPQNQYMCHKDTATCAEVPPGTPGSYSKEVCQHLCSNSLYVCNTTSATCERSDYGQSKDKCAESCKPVPPSPDLQGVWRGLQVSKGFAKGEWRFEVTASDFTLTAPDGSEALSGSIATLGNAFVLTSKAGVQRALYETENGQETVDLTLGIGHIGAATPASFSHAAQEYGFLKCLHGDICDFSKKARGPARRSALRRFGSGAAIPVITQLPAPHRLEDALPQTPADNCAKYDDCQDCVDQSLCGWCSTPVTFSDGKAGPRCAGFDAKSKATPFTCAGIYSTESCQVGYICNNTGYQCQLASNPGEGLTKEECQNECKPAAQTYVCNPVNHTCEKTTAGHGTSKLLCEASCQHIKPTNSTPHDVVGQWRGLEVDLGYVKGEFDASFDKSTFTWSGPAGELSGVTQTTGNFRLNLIVQKGPPALVGKTLYGIYSIVKGTDTPVYMSLALSDGGSHAPPSSFDAAMSGKLAKEYVLLK